MGAGQPVGDGGADVGAEFLDFVFFAPDGVVDAFFLAFHEGDSAIESQGDIEEVVSAVIGDFEVGDDGACVAVRVGCRASGEEHEGDQQLAHGSLLGEGDEYRKRTRRMNLSENGSFVNSCGVKSV